jgi:hypothetical protein
MNRKAYVWTISTGGSAPSCTLRVFVDDRDLVRDWDVQGLTDLCATYSRRLDR